MSSLNRNNKRKNKSLFDLFEREFSFKKTKGGYQKGLIVFSEDELLLKLYGIYATILKHGSTDAVRLFIAEAVHGQYLDQSEAEHALREVFDTDDQHIGLDDWLNFVSKNMAFFQKAINPHTLN
jgi:hypothetical protein